MQKFSSILVLLLLLVVTALAALSLKPGVRIVNGKSAKPGQFPFIVAILDSNEQFCNGSIIDKNWVITAAHCVKDITDQSVQILTATNLLHNGGAIYNVTEAIYHPGYGHPRSKNDIGLIKIDGEFEFNDLVQPIDFGYAESNDTVTVSGWGEAEDIYTPEDLRYIELRAWSLEECLERAQNSMGDHYLGPEQVCALTNDSINKGPCFGDSGGPLVSNGKLAGIVSYAFFPCATELPDVYTRPTAYIDWINQNIQE